MEKLTLPPAKLLYLISELWKQKELNDQEKIILKGFLNKIKEYVISDEPKVFEFLDIYNTDGNEKNLKQRLLSFLRKQPLDIKDADEDNDNDYEEIQPYQQDSSEITSPLGAALFKKKQKQQHQGINLLKTVLVPK